MNPDRVHPDARVEFLAAARYYDDHQPGLGAEFMKEIRRAVEIIDANSECGSLSEVEGVRTLRVRRFPYTVIFDSLTSPPFVAAIYHERRQPGGWKGRFS